jgi:hypothetical protein
MQMSMFSSVEPPVSRSVSPDSERAWMTRVATSRSSIWASLAAIGPSGWSGRTSPVSCRKTAGGHLAPSLGGWQNSGMGGPTECWTLSISDWPSDASVCSLSAILEIGAVPQQYSLSARACQGILRRAAKRGKSLPPSLAAALRAVASAPTSTATGQVTSAASYSSPKPGDPCHPLAAAAHPPAVAFHNRQDPDVSGAVTHPLGAQDNGMGVAYAINSHAGAADGDQTNRSHASGGPVGLGISADVAYALRGGRTQSVGAVRRLTPRECARLQGFPDDYLDIPYRGKPAADGPKYKALGNSMAVPVMRWIGQRIQLVREVAP